MRYDGTGVDASGAFPLITENRWMPFRIVVATEGKSSKGNYMVTVDTVCLDPAWKEYPVRHWVTFIPKDQPGAGIALHFLKSIGEPHEGVIDINPIRWERKTFMGKVTINEYEGKDGTMKKNNKFEAIDSMKSADELVPAEAIDKAPWD